MRDASRQPPDRIHLLRMPKLLFQLLAFGDVASDTLDRDHLATGVPNECAALFYPNDVAVLVDPLHRDRAALAGITPQQAFEEVMVVGMEYFEDYVRIGVVLSLIHISEPTRQAEISYAVFC